MNDCIFCMIVRGEIPAKILLEDDLTLAFDDITPQAPVHTLIIPKQHYEHLGDDLPAEVQTALLAMVPRVAEAKGIAERGYRVIINSGPDSAQSVRHLHLHVLGGRRMSEGMMRFAEEE